MEPVRLPVDKKILRSELTPEKFLRNTHKAHNEIYITTAHDSPQVMQELGRLREIAFRQYGGGTGLAADIDRFDTMPNPYKQIVVWNPEKEEIIGGYRFICGADVEMDGDGQPKLATAHLLNFSDKFITEYLPHTLELGRSFVRLEYQNTRAGAKGIFALDNLWDGLGALSVADPTMQYFFGKVTMYSGYNPLARDMILYFMSKHFPDPDNLLSPKNPVQLTTPAEELKAIFPHSDFRSDYKLLHTAVRKLNLNIPPLINAYMGLSPKMKVFGTAVNDEFGNVEETGILIRIDEILEEKRIRHIESYLAENHPVHFLNRLRSIINYNWKESQKKALEVTKKTAFLNKRKPK
jgi:hypothetical protein